MFTFTFFKNANIASQVKKQKNNYAGCCCVPCSSKTFKLQRMNSD